MILFSSAGVPRPMTLLLTLLLPGLFPLGGGGS
jgi:hypothetical protein